MTEKHIINHLGLKVLRSTHPKVRKIKRLQQGHSAHGNKVWRSSFALIDYFETYPLEPNSRVLEIGCGWGLSGLYVAKMQNANVTGIDIDAGVQAYFDLQNSLNDCALKFEHRSYESLITKDLMKFHYIIGSDICFWEEMIDSLLELIKKAKGSGVKKMLIADPGRPPFWELTDRCADMHRSEIISRKIYTPWKSEKYILVINLN